jgi:hypothetical protein
MKIAYQLNLDEARRMVDERNDYVTQRLSGSTPANWLDSTPDWRFAFGVTYGSKTSGQQRA